MNTLNLEITKKCNLNCKHCGIECGYKKNSSLSEEISIENINNSLYNAFKLGCKTLIIAGGEPLLSDNLWATLDTSLKLNLSVSILTNGLLINEDFCKRIQSYKNINFIRISLDYPSNDSMKEFRGKDHIVDCISNSLRLLKKYNIPSGIGMTIFPDNIHYIKSIAKIAFESGSNFFRAIPVVPIGMAKDLIIDENFYVDCLKEIISVSSEYPKNTPLFNAKSFIDVFNTTCPAGKTSISLSSNGTLGLCPLIDSNISFSNLKNESFENLYADLNIQKELLLSTVNNNCKSCEYFNLCKGGCLADNLSTNQEHFICLKRVFKKLLDDISINNLSNMHLSFSTQLMKLCKSQTSSMCFRALPIWSIFFTS